ncbi:hypothetical protein HYPSUDRAFT_206125 [Hypholoma sublateritium FD-334 SS-4]|uniref:Aminoglycoside phosphotransferase domain-containing protein n=1 Tax=Hypholoma sublateritium (strain FD-334 SS-4) TaxID=945553 RepID=A0A0D2NLI8_HYPSF|nr:hypothetical protein HYPSUDRAFT_206125 [Hypholoma sublateritium FD-334 SS-4]
MRSNEPFSLDWIGVDNPWTGVGVDLVALQTIVCDIFHVPRAQCGPPVVLNPMEEEDDDEGYARVYAFQLPSRSVVARLVAPVKPMFKTEAEVAAMDFVRSKTALPVPEIYSYCSDARNPVGVEWIIMEHMPGMMMDDALPTLQPAHLRRLAHDLVDLHDQLSKLRADGCGSIYHSTGDFGPSTFASKRCSRSLRWNLPPKELLRSMNNLCAHRLDDGYRLGPLNDINLLQFKLAVPPPAQTMPVSTSEDYVKLLAFNGSPTTRSDDDPPASEMCVELFLHVQNLYPNSPFLGPSVDAEKFFFSHGDLHGANILVDPKSGAVTGLIDWEAAAFRPLWACMAGVGWFREDRQRFLTSDVDPENFEDDVSGDAELRALFRTELHNRNPDLFACFLGGVELRGILNGACDLPRPAGSPDIFLSRYLRLGFWNEARRGPFPCDMNAWRRRRYQLDVVERERQQALKAAQNGKI